MNILHDSSALNYSLFLMFKQNYCVYQFPSPYSRVLKLLKLKDLQKVSEESYSEGRMTTAREKLGPHNPIMSTIHCQKLSLLRE